MIQMVFEILVPQRIISVIFAFWYEKILTTQHRTRMTRIRRIFTDNFNPCASVSSVQSVFYHNKASIGYLRSSAFICG